MKRTVFFILYMIGYAASFSQIPDFQFEKYTKTNGLANTGTMILFQDSRGYLWIGSEWGLNRYDGRLMKTFDHPGKNNLPDLCIRNFAEDKEGYIWIATAGGLCCFDPLKEQFIDYFGKAQVKNVPRVDCKVYIDKKNGLWLGTGRTLFFYDKANKDFKSFDINVSGKDPRVNIYVSYFLEDKKGRFWLGSSYGVKLFNKEKFTYESFHFEETEGLRKNQNATQGLFEDHLGNVWAGTWGGGILKFNEEQRKFERIVITGTTHDIANVVHDIHELKVNDIYYLMLATEGGLVFIDPIQVKDEKIVAEKEFMEDDDQQSLLSNGVWDIFRDRQQNFWISSSKGLHKLDPANQAFKWKYLPDKKLRNLPVYRVVPDVNSRLGELFFTTTSGWWKYNPATGVITEHPLPEAGKAMLSNLNRYLITDTGYWFTSQAGFGFYDRKHNHVTDLSRLFVPDKNEGLATGALAVDAYGRLWFSVYKNGVRIYDPKTRKIKALFSDSMDHAKLRGHNFYDIKADGERMLITTGPKMMSVSVHDLSYEELTTEDDVADKGRVLPRKIIRDQDGRLLLIGMQKIYTLSNGKLKSLYPAAGVADFLIYTMTEDSAGGFWVLANTGIYHTDHDFKKWDLMNNKIGLDNGEDINQVYYGGNDQLFLTSVGKVGLLSVGKLKNNSESPVVYVSRFLKGSMEEYFVSERAAVSKIGYKEPLEFEIAAINFSNEKNNRIFYKLEGWDDSWKEAAGNPVVRYQQLPPGNYSFMAKALNGDGVESKTIARVDFKVLPPFYRTWWFLGLCALLIAGGLYAIYRYRIRQIIYEEKLRSRIATDLHDDIGATLSSISFYSEAMRQQTTVKMPELTPMLNKMGETSRDMVDNMSDIVWAINPDNDSFEKMVNRMHSYAAELCAVKNIQLHFSGDEIASAQLRMEQRRNIYLIFKEALNNALKYADARNIYVHLAHSNSKLELMVKDDGKGFSATGNGVVHGGNGLKNMNARAEEINGKLIIDSAKEGTMVKLECKIT